jgi:type I restriction enzyme S subunit
MRVAPAIEAAYSRTRLAGGELLLTLVGTVGETAIVPAALAGWNTARAVAVIPVRDDIGAYWVQLALRAPGVRAMIDSRLNTTVQATLNLGDVAQLPIVLPPQRERDEIMRILGALDGKILIGRRMRETLEAMARALFNSWFVHFDPVRTKARGERPYLPDTMVDQFPASFTDSELGQIPEGWSVRGLDETANFLNGLALQKYRPTDGRSLPVIKIAQLRAGNTVGADLATADLDPSYIVQDGDIVFSWSGTLECMLWAGGPGALNQHLFKVTSTEYPRWLCYLAILSHLPGFRRIAAGKATTMGHIQRHHLTEAKVVVPPLGLLESMDRVMSPVVETMWRHAVESRTISLIREALLPRLLSGELRVSGAPRLSSGVVQ